MADGTTHRTSATTDAILVLVIMVHVPLNWLQRITIIRITGFVPHRTQATLGAAHIEELHYFQFSMRPQYQAISLP